LLPNWQYKGSLFFVFLRQMPLKSEKSDFINRKRTFWSSPRSKDVCRYISYTHISVQYYRRLIISNMYNVRQSKNKFLCLCLLLSEFSNVRIFGLQLLKKKQSKNNYFCVFFMMAINFFAINIQNNNILKLEVY